MSLRAAARRVTSEGIGLCLDLGHAHITAELRHTSLERLIEPVMDVVTLIHAHDNYGARRKQPSSGGIGRRPASPGPSPPPWPRDASVAPGRASGDAKRRPVILEVHPPYRPRVAELHDSGSVLFATS